MILQTLRHRVREKKLQNEPFFAERTSECDLRQLKNYGLAFFGESENLYTILRLFPDLRRTYDAAYMSLNRARATGTMISLQKSPTALLPAQRKGPSIQLFLRK